MLSSLTVSKAREGLGCYGSVEQAISLSPEVLLSGRNTAVYLSRQMPSTLFFNDARKLDVAIDRKLVYIHEGAG